MSSRRRGSPGHPTRLSARRVAATLEARGLPPELARAAVQLDPDRGVRIYRELVRQAEEQETLPTVNVDMHEALDRTGVRPEHLIADVWRLESAGLIRLGEPESERWPMEFLP